MLLWAVSNDVRLERRTQLSAAVEFLFKEYTPVMSWWELIEILKKFMLIGLPNLFWQGTINQIIYALVTTLVFLILNSQASPYRRTDDDLVATVVAAFVAIQTLTTTQARGSYVCRSLLLRAKHSRELGG